MTQQKAAQNNVGNKAKKLVQHNDKVKSNVSQLSDIVPVTDSFLDKSFSRACEMLDGDKMKRARGEGDYMDVCLVSEIRQFSLLLEAVPWKPTEKRQWRKNFSTKPRGV